MSIVTAFTVDVTDASRKALKETLERSADPKYDIVHMKIKWFDEFNMEGKRLVIISAEKLIDLPNLLWASAVVILGLYFWIGWSLWMLIGLFFALLEFVQSPYWLHYSFALTLRKAGYKGSQKKIATSDALRWVCFGRA